MNLTRFGFALALATAVTLPTLAPAQGNDRYEPAIVTLDSTRNKPPGTYVVREGDTLWELSEGVFGDSYFWPVLWSYNPQITNPHWIYPGDLIYLRPRRSSMTDKPVVYAKSRYTDAPRLEEILARFRGFITERQYRESGRIEASREERVLLGELDEAYVRYSIPKRILPGEEFTIYRPEKAVYDPASGKRLGWLVKHVGISRVLSVDRSKPYVKNLILKSYEEISRKDRVTKRVWDKEVVVPVENRVAAWARVAASFTDVTQYGEHDYVVIDKGFKQKVRRGNRLIIRGRGDGVRRDSAENLKKYPWENVGEVMIIEPFENTALCIVLRSFKEINDGQLLEMIQGY